MGCSQKVLACAYLVAQKSDVRERVRVVEFLYDVFSNRCDYAAILALLDQALFVTPGEDSKVFWRYATDFERQVAISILEESSKRVEEELTHIKEKLRSS